MKNIINIEKQLPFKFSNGKMDLKKIKYLVIHHEGVVAPARYNTLKKIQGIANMHVSQPARFGGHIAYMYIMDNIADIYQCYKETEVGYHAGNLPVNKSSLSLCVLGNYDVQKLSEKQFNRLRDFIIEITSKRPDLEILFMPGVKLHKEVRIAPTACPGKNLIAAVNKIRK